MGAKTGLLAYTTGDVSAALREPGATGSRADADRLLRRIYPDWRIEPTTDSTLCDGTYPREGTAYGLSVPGLEILCDQNVMVDHPSRLPQRYLDAAEGRTVILHAMHSVVDWLAFAVWKDGELVRSLSLYPEDGILENIGEPLPFEAPYWAGEKPVELISDWPDEAPYPLPFHPLELGEDALRALFGFVIEGLPDPNDVDAFEIPVSGFLLTEPSGPISE